MPLSMVCILRGTKGINKSVLCVLPCCELPFNTFPRAALEMRYRGPEIENNILNRPSAHVLFSVVRERDGEREGGSKTAVTFKIHKGGVLPSRLSRALQPKGNIIQFQCSLTVSREALSAQFWYYPYWTWTKRCFLSRTDTLNRFFCSAVFSSCADDKRIAEAAPGKSSVCYL